MQITVLIENTSNCSLCAEHGLSVYIEYNGMNYLLDTGASDTFSKNAQELGFSLKDIKQLQTLHENPTADSADVKALGQALLTEIDYRIASLQAMRSSLNKLVEQCPGQGPTECCPILGALACEQPIKSTEQ